MPKKPYRETITTIQLKKDTRDFLRTIKVYSVNPGAEDDPGYDGLFNNHIIPLLKQAAKSDDPKVIGEWFKQRIKK